MSLSYQEALDTLTGMFGPPWTQETLDAVLRAHNGHMENTVDSILGHGERDPQELVNQLKSGVKPGGADTSMDEALALQLAKETRGGRGNRGQNAAPASRPTPPPPAPKPKGRGTPTDLPPDFLRVPGQAPPSGDGGGSTMDADEALARMLQDELFSQELANNPEFAHLANRGRPALGVGRSRGHVGELPTRSSTAHRRGSEEGPKIMENLKEMGENAKKRLALLASSFNASRRGDAGGGANVHSTAAHEQRGLLDEVDDEQEMEFATFSGVGGKKRD